MTQKILAAHAGLKEVKAGQFIEAELDIVLANDITGAPVIKEFQKMGAEKVFDVNKVVLVPDHFTPNKDIKAAEQCKLLRDFAVGQEIVNYFEVGKWASSMRCFPKKARCGRGCGNRRRLPYLYLWRSWRLCHRNRIHRHGGGNGQGKSLVQGAFRDKI
jgi:hypothetical protein